MRSSLGRAAIDFVTSDLGPWQTRRGQRAKRKVKCVSREPKATSRQPSQRAASNQSATTAQATTLTFIVVDGPSASSDCTFRRAKSRPIPTAESHSLTDVRVVRVAPPFEQRGWSELFASRRLHYAIVATSINVSWRSAHRRRRHRPERPSDGGRKRIGLRLVKRFLWLRGAETEGNGVRSHVAFFARYGTDLAALSQGSAAIFPHRLAHVSPTRWTIRGRRSAATLEFSSLQLLAALTVAPKKTPKKTTKKKAKAASRSPASKRMASTPITVPAAAKRVRKRAAAVSENGKPARAATPEPTDGDSQSTAKAKKTPKSNGVAKKVRASTNGRQTSGRQASKKTKTPTKSKPTARKTAARKTAARMPESRIPNPESRSHTPASDRLLVDRALTGQSGAWDALYERCHQPLLAAIRAIIANRAADPNLIDELAARVWYAVVRDEGKLLNRFDPSRACSLTTYLALLAKDEASRLFRSERRRRRRETAVATSDRKTPKKSTAAQTSARITLAEFAATLTPAEKTFYEEIVVPTGQAKNGNGSQNGTDKASSTGDANGTGDASGTDKANGTEKSNGTAHSKGRSQANEWQLNHRVRRKLERFLTG